MMVELDWIVKEHSQLDAKLELGSFIILNMKFMIHSGKVY